MTNDSERKHCDFSCEEPACLTMDQAGVPKDAKWRSLVLFIRSLGDYSFLPERQRAQLQEELLQILRSGDFSEASYARAIAKQEAFYAETCDEKVGNVLNETAKIVAELRGLMLERKGQVKSLGQKTVDAIQSGTDPEVLVKELRSAFQEITQAMKQDAETLNRVGRSDALTGLKNRGAFDEELAERVEDWQREGRPLCLLMLDIDHFKNFNDEYGHRIGDQALKTVANLIMDSRRALTGLKFFAARYGGEEFAVILSGADLKTGLDVAEQIRTRVEKYHFIIRDADGNVLKRGIKVTVSIGVADMSSEWQGAFVDNLVDVADKALYAAKHEGRNLALAWVHEKGEALPDL